MNKLRNSPDGGMLKAIRLGAWLFVVIFLLYLLAPMAYAQISDRRIPDASYFSSFSEFYAGNYKTALDRFQAESRSSIKTAQSRWIDSICYETMVGECYYQTGILDQALVHYTMALEICAALPDWMLRVQFAPIRSGGPRKPYLWGTSTRQTQLGQFPSTMLISQGRINNNDVVKQGGVVQQAVTYAIQPQEIVRCTTLALRRRAEILGPISKNDPLSERLSGLLGRQINPPNHWSEAWADVERGLAFIAAGKESQGIPCLQRSVLAAGEFDHPLTCIALLELGRLALMRGEYPAALQFFEESSFSALDYSDYGVLEEAFRYAAITKLISNRNGFYAPLQTAWQWAKGKDFRQFRASLALSAAENYSVIGNTKDAALMLEDARSVIGRRKANPGIMGARLNYLSSQILFQQGKTQEGEAAYSSAMTYMRQGSRKLFQIAMADNLYTTGVAVPRTAMNYYNELLRDPLPIDWLAEPLETMAVLTTPHPVPMEHWFEVALERRDQDLAWEIADRARRHRFFSTLDMGGRLESLRWILESPTDSLDQQSRLQRQDILSRWPHYEKLSQQAQEVRAKLAAMPLVAEDQSIWKEQNKALLELASLSAQQDAILREISVRREPVAMGFPPLRSVSEIKKTLPNRHAVLAFFVANRRLHAILMNNSDYGYWEINAPLTLLKQVQSLLHEMGQYQANNELQLKELADEKWSQTAAKTLEVLLKGSRADFSKSFDELVIVPDGMLWFLPFEALQVPVDGKLQPLISRFRIRYAPTLSLATTTLPRRIKPTAKTAVVLGKLYPRDDESVAKNAYEKLAAVLPGTSVLKLPAPGPSVDYKVLFDRLIVYEDLTVNEQEPYAWSPAPIDRNKSSGSLADWMSLPWGGPEEIILPGFHTAAEDALKKSARGVPGDEVFLSVCGLMSCGARTIMLSRWRTGGQSSFDLMREFAQELPHTAPADAWQRAVLLQSSMQLNVEAEPRIKQGQIDEAITASHPFFWAGYMLIDSGQVQQKTEPQPDAKKPTPEKAPDKKDK